MHLRFKNKCLIHFAPKEGFILIILFILISSCSTNKVVKNHGTSFIKNKSKDLVINKSNKNDVLTKKFNPQV